MTKDTKDFEALPEKKWQPADMPTPASGQLADYYRTLGDGKLDYLGIRTGLAELDKRTLGLDGLIVLGGIAGQGKTSLALQLAYGACKLGTPTLFYSLEMPRRAIFTKILNRLAGIKYTDILLKGRPYLDPSLQETNLLNEPVFKYLTKEQVEKLKKATGELEETGKSFYVRSLEAGQPEINFESVEEDIKKLKIGHETEKVFAVIDHLQVFNVQDYKDQIDKEGKLITEFKKISERTGATILLISQKNKSGFTSRGLQTIKGSVDIVYLADLVMFLESEDEKGKAGEELDEIAKTLGGSILKEIDLDLRKNRYNAPGIIKLDFNGETSTFTEKN